MRCRVTVMPRPEVLDPQGRAVHHALAGLGWASVRGVRVGRIIDLDLDDGQSRAQAEADVQRMARELLANLIVEDFAIEWPDG